jgi:hypothetical protein
LSDKGSSEKSLSRHGLHEGLSSNADCGIGDEGPRSPQWVARLPGGQPDAYNDETPRNRSRADHYRDGHHVDRLPQELAAGIVLQFFREGHPFDRFALVLFVLVFFPPLVERMGLPGILGLMPG